MAGKKISDDTLDGVRACIVDKKNPGPCIDKVLEEAGIPQEQKAAVLQKALKEELD